MSSPQLAGNQTPERRDFRKEVTDSIIKMLEEGVAPWQKPWDPFLAVPFNPTSNNAYRGGNAIHLMAAAIRKGFEDPRWMTYKQAADNDWQVRKGEKGTQIEFWELKRGDNTEEKVAPAPSSEEDGVPKEERRQNASRFIHRVYTVFNAAQIDGVPAHEPKTHTAFAAVETGEQILQNSGAKITHDQVDRAFYSRSSDSIHLPPRGSFRDGPGYYGTALHELAHWTGHPDRLNRQTLNDSYRFGDQNYAREELRAELASLFLAAERGIPHDPAKHAAYVGSWIKALRDDKNEIFRAAQDASRATEFLLALERDKSLGETFVLLPEATAGDLEQETARIQADLESEPEPTSVEPNPALVMHESGQMVARFQPADGTVKFHGNLAGTDKQVAVDPMARQPSNKVTGLQAPSASELQKSLQAAEELTVKHLGTSARMTAALTDGGIYRGSMIGMTDHHLLQQISPKAAVAHPKELLDSQMQIGQKLSIAYSDSHATVREIRERARTQELAR
jgi:antirestriction protein ArdC